MTPLHSLTPPSHALRPVHDRNICPVIFYALLRYFAESSSLAQHPHFEEVGPGTGGRLLESLHERINVSSSDTAIGIYCFLILSITLVVAYMMPFFGLHHMQVRACGQKNKVLQF
jgi:hypothetical protein